MRKALKILLIAVCALVVLLACIVGAVHLYLLTDPGKRFLLHSLNSLFPGKIMVTGMEASLITHEAGLENVVLLGPDGKQILKAKHAYIKINLPALFRKKVIFEAINIEKPDFVLEVDKDNWLNIESAFVAKTPGQGQFNVYINSLTSNGGTFAYKGKDGKPIIRLENFDFRMSSAFENDTTIYLSVPKALMTLFVSNRKIDLGTGYASCTIFNDRIRDIRIATKKGSSTATLAGSITEMSKKAQLRCDLNLDSDMADLGDALGFGDGNTGRVTGRITASRDYDNPGLIFTLAYNGGTLGGQKIGKANLDGSLADKVVAIKRLSVAYASGNLVAAGTVDLRRVFPDSYFEGIKEEDAITYNLSITGTSLLINDLPGMPKGLKGTLNPRIALKGIGVSANSLRLETEFTAQGQGITAGTVLKREDLSLAGKIAYRRNTLDIRSLNARTGSISVSSQGSINLAGHTLNGIITMETPRIGDLLRRAGIDATGVFKASSRISGTFEKPVADIMAGTQGTTINDIPLGTIDLKALLDQNGKLNVSSCTISNRSSTIQVQGNVQVFKQFPTIQTDPALSLKADLKSINPGDFTSNPKLSGIFNGCISADGTVSDLRATMNLAGKDLSAEDIHLGDAVLIGSLSQGLLTISRLELTRKQSKLLVTGDAALIDQTRKHLNFDPDIHLKVQGDSLHIDDFFDRAKGTFSVSALMEGSLRHPIGDAILTVKDIDLGYQRFQELSMNIQADGGRFWVEPIKLVIANGENINGSGWIATDGTYAYSLGTQGLSLENLDFIKGHESAKGKIFFNTSGEGNLNNPVIAGRIAATNIMFNNKPIDDLTLSFELQDHKVNMQGNWNFSLKAMHDLSSGEFSTSIIFAETDLSPYFIIFNRPTFSGRLTGRIDTRGNIRSLKDIDMIADISSLDILHENKNLVQARNVSASYKNEDFSIPDTRIVFGENGWFDIKGRGDIKKAFSLDANGVIPTAALGIFFEDLSDSLGTIRVSSQFKTDGTHHEASAQLTLEDFAYTIPENGQHLHDVGGKIGLEGSKIIIKELIGQLDTGSFKIGGSVVLDGYAPRNIELNSQVRSLPITIPGMMDLTVDAETVLNASLDQSSLKSDVIIIDGTYYKDVQVNLLTGVIERILPKQNLDKGQFIPTPWPFMKNMALDVAIKRRGDVKVENNVAELTLNPDLRIIGTLINPILTGRIAVTDGTVTFENNDFTVSKGDIDFLNPYKTQARADIISKTKVRDWDITLSVEGDLDNLEFKLSSTPTEEPPDILSLLILGKTSRELTQNQTGVTVAPGAMAAELLAKTYGGDIKKATTLDILELKSSELTTSKGGENLKLTLGKELSRNITLKYEMETTSTGTIQSGVAEYKLLDNLLINGSQASDGVFGADIQYRYEFR